VTKDAEQLAALASVIEALTDRGIDYWLFGGWAVDFYAGKVTRLHDDVDLAVWLEDHDHVAELLASSGWKHAPHPEEDGGTGYEHGAVRLELTFLLRGDDGAILIPLRAGLDGALRRRRCGARRRAGPCDPARRPAIREVTSPRRRKRRREGPRRLGDALASALSRSEAFAARALGSGKG
jgi:hypothetical protein